MNKRVVFIGVLIMLSFWLVQTLLKPNDKVAFSCSQEPLDNNRDINIGRKFVTELNLMDTILVMNDPSKLWLYRIYGRFYDEKINLRKLKKEMDRKQYYSLLKLGSNYFWILKTENIKHIGHFEMHDRILKMDVPSWDNEYTEPFCLDGFVVVPDNRPISDIP